MRPLKLTVSAFGPYKKELTLDMDRLGTDGLYLITGETGAGKTTVFDAICFALYGKTSSDDRTGSMMRSKYARPEDKTFVRLTFLIRDNEYTVERNPEYERPRKNSKGGMTKENANAILTLPDGKTIEGLKDVNEKISEILPMDFSQFTQIAMIAQGDFRKLLLAKSSERMEILRKIFHTQKYQKFSERIYNEANAALREREEQGLLLSQELSRLLPISEVNVLCADYRDPEGTNLLLSEYDEKLRALTAALTSRHELLKQEISQLEKTHGAMNEKQKAFVRRKALVEEAAALKQTLSTNEEQLASLRLELQEAEGRMLFAQQIRLSFESYEKLEGIRSSLLALKEQMTVLDRQTEQQAAEYEACLLQLEQLEQRYQNALDEQLRIGSLSEQMAALGTEIELCSGLFSVLSEKECTELEVEKAKERFRLSSDRYATFDDRHKHALQAYYAAEAGMLAEQLVNGEPCPVCGSTRHPQPAVMPTNVPTKAELDELSRLVREAADEMSESAAELRSKKEFLDQIEKKAGLLLARYETDKAICADAVRADLELQRAKLSQLEQEREDARRIALLRPELEEKLAELKETITRKKEKLANAELRRAELLVDAGHRKEELSALGATLAYPSLCEAQAAYQAILDAREQAKKKTETAEGEILSLREQLSHSTGEIQSLEVILAEYNPDELSTITASLVEAQTALDQLNEEQKTLAHAALTFSAVRDAYLSGYQKYRELDARAGLLKHLSDTVNGKLPGKEKLSLEAYVQRHAFERILARANRRLALMCKGQYSLVRREEGRGNAASGLELDVLDHDNGTTRSASTLSGGESFQASLALALGLADEVQSSIGEISLDTLFVDEGFGSLDERSLATAYEALATLTGGKRLVGIISHTPYLKEKILTQIVVSKEKFEGSTAEIRLP